MIDEILTDFSFMILKNFLLTTIAVVKSDLAFLPVKTRLL